VVPRRFGHPYGLALEGQTRDPDALLSRAGRHLFVVPWREFSLVGVWHAVYDGDPDAFRVTARELGRYIAEVNAACPGLGLRPGEVRLWNAGLVPFGENRPGARDLSYGKRSLLVDHARGHGPKGLVTLIGIRFTMARGDAARAMDIISAGLGRGRARPVTDRLPVYGGDTGPFEHYVTQALQQAGPSLDPVVLRALLQNYGTAWANVLGCAGEQAVLLETVGSSTVVKAEVVHAVREEMAMRLADVVFRRTDLATGGHPGQEAIRVCAETMGAELGWTAARRGNEIQTVQGLLAARTCQAS